MLSYTNLELIILITVIFNAFFESVIMFIFDSDIYNFNKLSKSTTYIIKLYYDIVNFLLVLISVYLLFVKKTRNIIAVVLCIIILLKGALHLLISKGFYKYLHLSYENEQKLLVFHDHFALYVSIINICLTSYLLRRIFFT